MWTGNVHIIFEPVTSIPDFDIYLSNRLQKIGIYGTPPYSDLIPIEMSNNIKYNFIFFSVMHWVSAFMENILTINEQLCGPKTFAK